jgi:hypothetical protein
VDSYSNGLVCRSCCVHGSSCHGTINSRNDCSEHGKWFDLSGNGLFGGWLSRHISVLGWCNVDLCCNYHRTGRNGTINSCYYCHDCSEHDCYDCNNSGNNASDCCAEPGWNVGIQHG